jgi:hypothetical protein
MDMLSYNAALLLEMKKQIYQEIEVLKDNLIHAHHMDGFDYSGYKHQVGRIEGLRRAIELLDEAESVLNGDQ